DRARSGDRLRERVAEQRARTLVSRALARREQAGTAVDDLDSVVDLVADQDHTGAVGDVRVVRDIDQDAGHGAALDEAVEDADERGELLAHEGPRGEQLDGEALRVHRVTPRRALPPPRSPKRGSAARRAPRPRAPRMRARPR